eukprot:TRINITY_DN67504_c4_g1_i2.p1 TRINITY_DN67504_c4_g1~~TRINITY_DN67504_c4_g1_i2.p1  ORF type:complete len:446 (+),score=65.65 TRINITY_DN67504_c4_g1_i2:509-1846(+)
MSNDDATDVLHSYLSAHTDSVEEQRQGSCYLIDWMLTQKVAPHVGLTTEQLHSLKPGVRRRYHDDVTVISIVLAKGKYRTGRTQRPRPWKNHFATDALLNSAIDGFGTTRLLAPKMPHNAKQTSDNGTHNNPPLASCQSDSYDVATTTQGAHQSHHQQSNDIIIECSDHGSSQRTDEYDDERGSQSSSVIVVWDEDQQQPSREEEADEMDDTDDYMQQQMQPPTTLNNSSTSSTAGGSLAAPPSTHLCGSPLFSTTTTHELLPTPVSSHVPHQETSSGSSSSSCHSSGTGGVVAGVTTEQTESELQKECFNDNHCDGDADDGVVQVSHAAIGEHGALVAPSSYHNTKRRPTRARKQPYNNEDDHAGQPTQHNQTIAAEPQQHYDTESEDLLEGCTPSPSTTPTQPTNPGQSQAKPQDGPKQGAAAKGTKRPRKRGNAWSRKRKKK